MLTNQRKMEELSTITLSRECLVILQNKLPLKSKDQRIFSIPSIIGSLVDEKALVDLAAWINMMAYKGFRKLGFGELQLR